MSSISREEVGKCFSAAGLGLLTGFSNKIRKFRLFLVFEVGFATTA